MIKESEWDKDIFPKLKENLLDKLGVENPDDDKYIKEIKEIHQHIKNDGKFIEEMHRNINEGKTIELVKEMHQWIGLIKEMKDSKSAELVKDVHKNA